MAKFDDKISHLINQQAPDFVLDDHPYFLEFVKAYYTFMESAELTLTNIGDPDVIQLETQTGTITYSSGAVAINALTIASIENIRGSASSVIELTVTPSSNDIVPVRAQIIDIDVANSTFTVQADTLVGGSANAGIGYTTTSSY